MPLYRDDAVVLRVHKLGEADRIITLLTRRHGRVRAVGRGVRRTTSKFGARLEPGSHVDVQVLTRNNFGENALPQRKLDTITQTESIAAYGARLAEDYPRWTAACTICEAAERLTPEEGEPALRLYLLVVGALRALTERDHAPGLVLDAFLLRSMATAGWAPALTACAVCDRAGRVDDGVERILTAFHVGAGGVVCAEHRPPGATRPPSGTVELMQALLASDWRQADASAVDARRAASTLTSAHLQWHLERGLRSLPFVDRDLPGDRLSEDG
ncbi:MAG: DNA repair protein RecO [Actinomycetota bacterium]|nr:DNA repair protein RecO [Actinomycetota bacterium]